MKINRILQGLAVGAFISVLAGCPTPHNPAGSENGVGGMGGKNGAFASGAGNLESFRALGLNTRQGLEAHHTIYFSYDNDEIKPYGLKPINASSNHDESLSPNANQVVHAFAAYIMANPNTKIRLEGNTDARGSREYNIALGERRAKAVASVLEADGVSESQIDVVSYGKEKPVAEGTGEDAYSQNRRVDISFE